jgi:voltage-gated potassium channel
VGLVLLIVANIIAVILQTEPMLGERYAPFFDAFEAISVAIFTIEYLLRLWSITVDPRYQDPVTGRLRFMVTPLAIIDLVSVLPFYLPFFIPVDLRTLRVLRLLRVFRLFKVGRYSEAMEIFVRVYRNKRAELFVAVAIALVLLVISSSLMYSVEHDVQPDKFPSILGTMWWAMATLTTIGYGDVAPITPLGKVLSGCIAVIGIALFGLPAGIFASGFIEELQGKKGLPSVCPHCGEVIERSPNEGEQP